MGDRLGDYGFYSPFDKGSGKTYISGNGADQWLLDISTYNKILKDYGISSSLEFKQQDGSWGNVAPKAPRVNRYSGDGIFDYDKIMPEYRWKISGDVNSANQQLKNLGYSFEIPTLVDGVKKAQGRVFISSADPLGIGGGAPESATYRTLSQEAYNRAYENKSTSDYYLTQPLYSAVQISPEKGGGKVWQWNADVFAEHYKDTNNIAKEFFNQSNTSVLRDNPELLKNVLTSNPQIKDLVSEYVQDRAAWLRSRDSGGGLGVIARGLGGVAQFASLASGLNALVTGLGSLASGAGLQGAFGAALDAAGAMPDIGSVVGGIAGSPTIGNLANIGVGGIVGGEAGGLPGAALGAGGALIGAGIDQAGGFTDFLQDPLGNILGAVGLGGAGGLTGSQLAAMEAASQVGMGSTAQYTPPSSIGQNVLSTDFVGGVPNELIEVVASAGDAAQLGGGLGSSAGGALGSAAGSFFNNAGGAAAGNLNVGGLLDTGNMITVPTPGDPTGSIQTTATGNIPTAGTGAGGTGVMIGADGLPIGAAGPYSDAYGAGMAGSSGGSAGAAPGYGSGMEGGALGGAIGGTGVSPGASLGTDLNAAPYGTPSYGTYGTQGLLNLGAPGDGLMLSPTSMYGSYGTGTGVDGLGGDGLGGDGSGGGGLGMGGGYPYGGLLAAGGQPGSIGDIASFIEAQSLGKKKKGGQSFYGKLPQPKRRKGIRLRRA